MFIRFLALILLTISAPIAQAGALDDVIEARIIPGWRMADGTHMAGLQLTLKEGWKTYWRAPGDVGIPPQFDWRSSGNLTGVEVRWPSPLRMVQDGIMTIGYKNQVVLPLAIKSPKSGRAIQLQGALELGVCRDVCVPVSLNISAVLPPDRGKPDARIVSAIAAQPHSAREARVTDVSCKVSPTRGGLRLTAEITMPGAGGEEMVIVETGHPQVWVAPTKSHRVGKHLVTETELMHVEGKVFMLDRSALRLTVLGRKYAVDIQGCTAG